jgi:hypothetical protein
LLLDRDRQSLASTEKNPYIQALDSQIESLRLIVLKNINSYLKGLTVSRANLQNQSNSSLNKIENVPAQARIFLDYTRQQTVKQDLYVYLLQKREETAISKTSTISTARVVDPAKSSYEPDKSKISLVFVLCLIMGFVCPLVFLGIREMLNVKIISKYDVEEHTKIPVVGEISHNDEEQSLVVTNKSRSIISEQFRGLRTNSQFLLNADKPQVIMVTSSMSGEGKSFISLNLGSVLALSGKKVVFIELDLRKPKLSQNIGIDNSYGFTNYAISNTVEVDAIIKPTWFSEDCFIISSGAIPPNPS